MTNDDRGPAADLKEEATAPVAHWYDFVCPFCYVGQDRSAILTGRGFTVVNLPYRIHPEIPPEGVQAGPRSGPMYEFLESEAQAAKLPLHWPSRLPDTGYALAAAEWSRRHRPAVFDRFRESVFEAHFALGEDIGDRSVVGRLAAACGLDTAALDAAMRTSGPMEDLEESERAAGRAGMTGTPAWLFGTRLVQGLQPRSLFETVEIDAV